MKNAIDILKNYIEIFYKKHKKKPDIKNLKLILKTKGLVASDSAIKNLLEQPIKIDIKKDEFKVNMSKKISNIEFILILLLIFIGVVCTCVSIYYSCFWLVQYNSAVLALFLAGSMILFAAIAPVIKLFVAKKHTIKIYSMMSIVIFLSILSTIAGQYNSRIQTENKSVKETIQSNNITILYNKLLQDEKDLKEELKRKQEEAKQFQKSLNTLYTDINDKLKTKEDKARHKWEWNFINKNLDKANNEVKSLVKDLQKIKHEINNMLKKSNLVNISEETKVETGSFYIFLNSIFVFIKPNMIEFIMSISFAIIIDFLAPLCLYIGFSLLKRKKD